MLSDQAGHHDPERGAHAGGSPSPCAGTSTE
jgi:hypothetical protein